MTKQFTTSDGAIYEIDEIGVIHHTNPVPYKYDATYVSTYDTESYRRENDKLQALRYGFVVACHGHTPGKILDFGCGNLAFVKFASQGSWAVGYDITGLPGTTKELQPAPVYTFWDALEHVPDPAGLIKSIECDTICISLPWCHYERNGQEWFETWKHRKPNEHLHHFNAASLQRFMFNLGYEKVAISHHEDLVRKPSADVQYPLPNILSMGFRKRSPAANSKPEPAY